MEYGKFIDWLITENKMSERSAKDVVSRSKRALAIVNQDMINGDTMELLISSSEFANCSMSIKSQLKRAVTLYMEFSLN